jgi:hypothetical protein
MRTRPYCPDCQRSYHDIRNHYQTQKHFRNAASSPHSPECTICMESCDELVQCTQCVYTWCTRCNTSMTRCPYCRLGEPNPTTLRPPPRIRRLLHQLERWRRRNVHELPSLPPLMVRMSWDEVRFLATLMMQHHHLELL